MEKIKNLCVENSASILTGLGVVGVWFVGGGLGVCLFVGVGLGL